MFCFLEWPETRRHTSKSTVVLGLDRLGKFTVDRLSSFFSLLFCRLFPRLATELGYIFSFFYIEDYLCISFCKRADIITYTSFSRLSMARYIFIVSQRARNSSNSNNISPRLFCFCTLFDNNNNNNKNISERRKKQYKEEKCKPQHGHFMTKWEILMNWNRLYWNYWDTKKKQNLRKK